MRLRISLSFVLFLLFCWMGIRARPEPVPTQAPPVLINTCLITKNVDRLVAFYEPVLQIKAERTGKDYAEFHTGEGVLAIFSVEARKNTSQVLHLPPEIRAWFWSSG